MDNTHYQKAEQYLESMETKGWWIHIAIFAGLHGLLALADAIWELIDRYENHG